MTNIATVLVVDDEAAIRRLLKRRLSNENYCVVEAESGKAGLARIKEDRPDVVILDLCLPDIDGLDMIALIREQSPVPIVVLSARDDECVKVDALLRGADDYVTKPFGMDELLAQLVTALRHRLQEQGTEPVFRSGELTIDLVRRRISVGANEVKLTPQEFNLLRLLVSRAGKVLTHQQVSRELYGRADNVQSVRVHVRLLRQKLEPDPVHPRYIATLPGIGYRLEVLDPLPRREDRARIHC